MSRFRHLNLHHIFCGSILLCTANVNGASATSLTDAAASPVDYVSTLVGTQSKFSLSTGNTYPAIALPWGMNFWTPQTGKMGDGWAYTYITYEMSPTPNLQRGTSPASAPYSFSDETR